ncbi:hypothetical protein AAFF_G00308240 [Aldrovandia affinis]|uniref:BTB domain-containing protein n=1 Tax=Aldrovandia affinis TaxID=143900 RepID=A0AAD7SQI5_9TELE|nr:hypothetical protein AAFF_G00308240 [Aldrovandia affinis]
MESSGEGGKLHRKLSLPARFGSRVSLRRSPKPSAKTSKPPTPDPPDISLKPPALPPKPARTTKLYSNLPELPSKPPELTPKPLKLASKAPELIPKPNTQRFSSNEHAAAILQGCEHLRSDATLCDVTLESGDGSETFPVHRVIMASASEYFRAMFTGGMKEQQEGLVKLPGVSGRGLRTIIDFIYRGGVTLDLDCLRDTLEAANHLQVVPVLTFCSQLLNSKVTVENCVEVERLSSELCPEEVQAQVREFIRQNFSALVQSGRYLRLSERCMNHVLESHALRGFTEAELYRAARDWLDADGGRGASTPSP